MPKIKDLGITVVPEQFRPPEIGGGGGCTGVTFCTDCTTQPFSICGTSPGPCAWTYGCTDCTTQPFSFCGTTRVTGTVACRLQSRFPTVIDVTTPCGGSFVGPGTIRQIPGLRAEDIAVLREQLNEHLKSLDEYEKALGPQSVEEVDAREKQLNEELAKLKSVRAQLGKKK